ncbi:MAG: alginate lyase family protein [Mariniphaga sp.]
MKTKIFTLSTIILLMISGITFAQNWRKIKSVEDICNAYPNEMKKMLAEFNPGYPGMEKVKTAWESGDLVNACAELLEYYKSCNNALHLRKDLPEKSDRTEATADTILKNVFVIQNVRGQVPWGDDGHRDWYWKGPNNDREWAWLSNRHSQINHVFNEYLETGNPKYAEYIDLFLRDFIIKSMPYPAQKGSESIWRGLEVAARAKVWSRIFYGMLNSEYLSPATRLLMLSSLPDHAHYNRNFHGGNNWLTMEMTALATLATNFPEYKKSEEWLDYSIEAMVASMKDQVYPDGVQTELTSHYHNVSLSNFELFKEICDRANKPLPEFFNQTIEDMYFYIAHAVRPDGNRILNNDGDRGSDRERILKGAQKFNKPDWEYIATNGQSGMNPSDEPSYFFPWAGHLISRSGFDKDAHWSFFDVGPWGSGHQHNDKLHISIAAYGRDLLVDAGRFAYTGEVAEKFRPYARGSQGHNVLLIDGKGQEPGPRLAEEPVSKKHWLITGEYDYAWNSFDKFIGLEGECVHTRRFFYVRGDLWVVVDDVKTDLPRKIDALWHWHPECDVAVDGNRVFTQNEIGNLQVIPVGEQDWKITFVKGQEEPEIQGWYSEEYNKFEPNVASIYSTNIESDSRFVWVLFPSEKVETGIQAEIISESSKEIKIKVWNERNDHWVIDVPLE